MSQTKEGAIKARETMLKKDPNYYANIGKLGGQMGTTGGFHGKSELAREMGRKGGLKRWSKRDDK